MKRIVSFVCIALCAFMLFACRDDGEAPTRVVISVPSSYTAGGTLEEYMSSMSERGEISFTVENGMVTVINGRSNAFNSYWMLYTDDGEHSDAEWGSVKHDGKTFLSATLGAGTLPVKAGCTYIWVYTAF